MGQSSSVVHTLLHSGTGEGVIVGVSVGVEVGVEMLNVRAVQEVFCVNAASGSDDGTFGATGEVLVWKSLIAVKTATPAKIKVAIIINIVVIFFFILSPS